jgi:hypothetical protein
MMSAMQIYVYDIRQSTGTARSYAYHQLELHMLVLTHLGKTYWTADLQHNLFNEALKALSGNPSSLDRDVGGSTASQHTRNGDPEFGEKVASPTDIDPPSSGMMHGTLDEFLLSFNPFMGVQIPPNELR